jgi:BirA family biotin operon repressor/biotin-[acetyl-CoA-carboxylase] ligase
MRGIGFQKDIYLLLKSLSSDRGNFVSGEELSRAQNISRTALWKKINLLRELGYKIEGHKSKGYRLISSPDIPYPWEIYQNQDSIWQNIIYYRTIKSTNTEANALASQGAPHGTVVIAEKQTGGKGRIGRKWESPSAGNIYLSFILRPEIPPYLSPQFTLAAGVGIARTVEEITGVKPELKWPNDLLLDRKKFCGVLTELNSETDRLNFIVMGIGINLNSDLEDYPESLRNGITTLKIATSRVYNRNEFILKLLNNLQNEFTILVEKGFSYIKMEWEEYFCMKNEVVIISSQREKLEGKAIGIDNNGAFLLQLKSGRIERILSGDVNRLRRV